MTNTITINNLSELCNFLDKQLDQFPLLEKDVKVGSQSLLASQTSFLVSSKLVKEQVNTARNTGVLFFLTVKTHTLQNKIPEIDLGIQSAAFADKELLAPITFETAVIL